MKIIAILPVRNEAWIIRHTLTILEQICDVIIVADGDSTDKTREICQLFNKVKLISAEVKGTKKFQKNRREILLDRARDYEGYNYILAIDADELLTAMVMSPDWENILDSMKPGDARHFRWYWIWKSPFHFREDQSVWSKRWMYCFFRDDRRESYSDGNWHESRIPKAYIQRSIEASTQGLLHYAQVGKNRLFSRQAHYRIMDYLHQGISVNSINSLYAITRDERDIGLKCIPRNWISPWQKLGLDFDYFPDPELNYFDIEILQYFKQFDTTHFANLDIWDINWEYKRQLALDQEVEGIPETSIHDPRNLEQRLYHSYLHRHIKNPIWREPQRPLVDGLKRIGFKREHFERLGILKDSKV